MTGEHRGVEWERGWDGHERAQLLRMARLSLREKVEWLEQAQAIARALQEAQKRVARADPHDLSQDDG
jgi:hypothetical protein